jgi:hypothetical protein
MNNRSTPGSSGGAGAEGAGDGAGGRGAAPPSSRLTLSAGGCPCHGSGWRFPPPARPALPPPETSATSSGAPAIGDAACVTTGATALPPRGLPMWPPTPAISPQ